MASSKISFTKALLPSVDPVFTNKISPLYTLISGDSSYFNLVIYVFLHLIVILLSTIFVGLKVRTPPSSFETISASVYPLKPIRPLRNIKSSSLCCSQVNSYYLQVVIYYVFIPIFDIK